MNEQQMKRKYISNRWDNNGVPVIKVIKDLLQKT